MAFFIVPDVYIGFATLYSLRAGLVAWTSSVVGSLVAVCVIYALIRIFGVPYVDFLDAIPGISGGLLDRTAISLVADGLPWTPLLVLGGIPLKVYAGLATTLGFSLGSVFLWTVFARVVRIAPVYALLALVRLVFRRSIDTHARGWFIAYVIGWSLFYAFYFMRMRGV